MREVLKTLFYERFSVLPRSARRFRSQDVYAFVEVVRDTVVAHVDPADREDFAVAMRAARDDALATGKRPKLMLIDCGRK